jgi:CRISPR-associated protein Cas1
MKDYYIFQSGRLRRSENTIKLESSTGEKKSLPIHDIYSIHLFGEIDLNTKLVVFLNQHGIPLHFYNYYGYYSGSFYPREKLLSGFLIVKQVQHYLDTQKRLEIAKEFVRTSIHNILSNLQQYNKRGKNMDEFISRIKTESEIIDEITNIPELMGIEGRSRKIYFSSFDSFLRKGFEFEKRTKLPPQNMLNSLISFGNSLLYATILTEIYHTQLTPTISYLHEPGERRYSLSLDISEVFKPIIVDRIIFNLVNNRIIKPGHFDDKLNASFLNEQGRKIFVSEYKKKLEMTVHNTTLKRNIRYQRLIRIECFKLIKHILGEKTYKGLRNK